MGLAKYSPTVGRSYSKDQNWFEKNGGGYGNGLNPSSQGDNQGYDSYGYSMYNDRDRAGNTESDYLCDSIAHDVDFNPLYERVSEEWSYSKPTILELNEILQAKIDSDDVFKKLNADLVAVIDIIEEIGGIKYDLRKVNDSFGDDEEFHRQNDIATEVFREASTKFDALSEQIESFYENSEALSKA